MKNKNLFAVVAVLFMSILQMGCGTAQQGNCAAGQVFQNGVCTYTGANTGYPNYQNPGTTTGTNLCTSGQSYLGNFGTCNPGYTLQGNMCVCTGTTTTNTTTSPQCQNQPGTRYVNYPQEGVVGCYPQGVCQPGYALAFAPRYQQQMCFFAQ